MCGILGYSHLAGSLPAGLLTTALEALAHRGPDHHGTFYSERMSLGATRLRILDLDGGDQPLFSSDRDVVVVFNGEIFNYPELRAELEAEGFRFETRCDTEVVLNAFLRWGGSCFSRLRGMFAIAHLGAVRRSSHSRARPHGHQASLLLSSEWRNLFRF